METRMHTQVDHLLYNTYMIMVFLMILWETSPILQSVNKQYTCLCHEVNLLPGVE